MGVHIPHQPDPDEPAPPVPIVNDKAHVRIDIAGLPATVLMVRGLRVLQRKMRADGCGEYADQIDRILTEWEIRK